MTAVMIAFLAGVLTIAAPCTLPLLPVILAASIGRRDTARPVFIAVGFVTSFAIVVILFSTITQIWGVDQSMLRAIAAILLIIFGCLMLWPRPFERLSPFVGALLNRNEAVADRANEGPIGGLVLGATLGLVWTPCAGPVLGSILTLVATSTEIEWGALLLIMYAAGAAIPMLAIAYGGQSVTARVRSVARVSRRLQQGFGVLVIAFAVATYLDYDTAVTAWLSGFYPNGNIGL